MTVDLVFSIELLASKFNSIEASILNLKESMHLNQLLVEQTLDSYLSVDKKTCQLNSFRNRLIERLNQKMILDLKCIKLNAEDRTSSSKSPNGISGYLRNVDNDYYLKNTYLLNENYFGKLVNEERLFITNLSALKFIKYLKFLNLDNSLKSQLKLEYISFLINKLDSNDYLESNCVRFEFLKNSNVLVNYKTLLNANTTLRNLEIINANSTLLYSTMFLQPSVKFFRLKVDHLTNQYIYILNKFSKSDDYIFEAFNLRLERQKSFKLFECIKNDFNRVKSMLISDFNDLILFTFHVYENLFLISLKRRFKHEFYHLIYEMEDDLKLKTIIGTFNTKVELYLDETVEIINIEKSLISLITFTKEFLFFISENREFVTVSKLSGRRVNSIDFVDQNEIDFYFDFTSKQFAFFYPDPIMIKSSNKNHKPITDTSLTQQHAKFMVYNFKGEFLADNFFSINILNKFYKIFFKSYFRTGLSTRVFLKYPTLNA